MRWPTAASNPAIPSAKRRSRAPSAFLGPCPRGNQRLMSLGLIEMTQGRGLAVTKLDRQQILEIYTLREAMEATAARLTPSTPLRLKSTTCESSSGNLPPPRATFRGCGKLIACSTRPFTRPPQSIPAPVVERVSGHNGALAQLRLRLCRTRAIPCGPC